MAVCYSRMPQIQTLVMILACVSSLMAPGPCKKIKPTSPICVNAPADCGALPVPDCAGAWTCGELMECVFVCEDGCTKDADCPAKTSCQQGQCVEMQSCYYAPPLQGNCLPDGVLCALYGSAGSVVDCTIHLAAAEGSPMLVTGMIAFLGYDAAQAGFLGFFDKWCVDMTETSCMEIQVPPGDLWPTGTYVQIHPPDPADWQGDGQLYLFALNTPMTPMGTAVVVAGAMLGNSELIRVRFKLKTDISISSPLFLVMKYLEAGNAVGSELCIVSGGIVLCQQSN